MNKNYIFPANKLVSGLKYTFANVNIKSLKNSIAHVKNTKIEISEDERFIYVKNMPAIYGDYITLHKIVYDQESLKQALLQYKETIKIAPYMKFMFNGHVNEKDQTFSSFMHVVGIIDDVKIDEQNKCGVIDFKILKNSNNIFADILDKKSGTGIGISAVLEAKVYNIAEDSYISKFRSIYDEYEQLKDVFSEFANKTTVLYATDIIIKRFDIVTIPAFGSKTFTMYNSVFTQQTKNFYKIRVKTKNAQSKNACDDGKIKITIKDSHKQVKSLLKNYINALMCSCDDNNKMHDKFFEFLGYYINEDYEAALKILEKIENCDFSKVLINGIRYILTNDVNSLDAFYKSLKDANLFKKCKLVL